MGGALPSASMRFVGRWAHNGATSTASHSFHEHHPFQGEQCQLFHQHWYINEINEINGFSELQSLIASRFQSIPNHEPWTTDDMMHTAGVEAG